MATAKIIVDDVAPVFTPNDTCRRLRTRLPRPATGLASRWRRITATSRSAHPFENGTGAVYLYDGVTTANEANSTYNYGQLIYTFADPNPEPGDEFGASLAVVGNDLVVGAPGSWLSGPGDGVAYVFDANVESTTFGQLLATLEIPDPAGLTDAHFGAAVGTTNTNIVIGAPGKDSGTGEAYEFEGGTIATGLGNPLPKIINPDGEPGSEFGAAVAGIGNNIIVGAPGDSTAGAGTGTIYLFDGDERSGDAAIVNPHPADSTGFGSAVASVGANVLVGSPDDNTAGQGAGAAFLFDPTGLLLKTFVAARRRRRRIRHFGRRHAEHSLDRRTRGVPGHARRRCRLPRSTPIRRARPSAGRSAPCKRPRPRRATLSAPRSGSTTGDLIVGAAGAIGSGITGAEAVDLYQQGATISLSSVMTYATPGPYDSVIVSGTFLDANTSATLNGHDQLGRWVGLDYCEPPARVVRFLRSARLHRSTRPPAITPSA